jgi:UDP-N-acetylglucosamine 2-epimerase
LAAKKFTILIVVGARPNFMKVAPVITAIRNHNGAVDLEESAKLTMDGGVILRHLLFHTGQHYDASMSDYGTNILAGITSAGIRQAITRHMERKRTDAHPEKWDGRAAQRIVSILVERFRAQAASVSPFKGEHGQCLTKDGTQCSMQHGGAMNLPAIL